MIRVNFNSTSGPIGYYLAKPLSREHISTIMGFAAATLMIFVLRELIPQAYKEDSGYVVDASIVTGFFGWICAFSFSVKKDSTDAPCIMYGIAFLQHLSV